MDKYNVKKAANQSQLVDMSTLPRLKVATRWGRVNPVGESKAGRRVRLATEKAKSYLTFNGGSKTKNIMEKSRREAREHATMFSSDSKISKPTHLLNANASAVSKAPKTLLEEHRQPAAPLEDKAAVEAKKREREAEAKGRLTVGGRPSTTMSTTTNTSSPAGLKRKTRDDDDDEDEEPSKHARHDDTEAHTQPRQFYRAPRLKIAVEPTDPATPASTSTPASVPSPPPTTTTTSTSTPSKLNTPNNAPPPASTPTATPRPEPKKKIMRISKPEVNIFLKPKPRPKPKVLPKKKPTVG
jgi:hypothetical protein